MATVCVDPKDFTQDVNGRLQIRAGCGLQHTDSGIAVLGDSQDFTCDDTDGLQINPGCGIQRTADGIAARVANADFWQENTANNSDVTLEGAGNRAIHENSLTIDLRDWCSPGDDTPPVMVTLNATFLFRLSGAANGWDAQAEAELEIDGGAPISYGGLWVGSNLNAGAFVLQTTLVEVVQLLGGATHNITWRLRITNNSAVNVLVDRRAIRQNVTAITRAG